MLLLLYLDSRLTFFIQLPPKSKPLVDFVAELHGYPDWEAMHQKLCSKMHELHGMQTVRFIGNDIVPYDRGMPAFCKKAGYIFIFNDGNSTRFDIGDQMLGLRLPLQEMFENELSREDFVKKHGPAVFSVEKVGDETFGTKKFRTLIDVKREIGYSFTFRGKQVDIREKHMPKAVGKKKSFVTCHGTFEVTRLVLD